MDKPKPPSMPPKTPPKTPIDEALLIAQQDNSQANYFYDAFLNADLIFPVQRTGTTEGKWERLGMSDRFSPLFLAFDENKKAVPVFDTLARLKEWAAERKLDYVAIRGHLLLRIVDNSVGILLNLGTPFHYTLTADILNSLRRAMKPVRPL